MDDQRKNDPILTDAEGRSPLELRLEAPIDRFLAEVEPKLKRLMATYRIPNEDVEDILQQSLPALRSQWEQVRDPEAWLYGTVKRNCLLYLRDQRRRLYKDVDAAVLEVLSYPSAPSQERSDFRSDLESLIDRLPSRCQTLLRLRFLSGYGPEEVARELGYRVSGIGKITNRCLSALSREILASGLEGRLQGRQKTEAEADAKDPDGEPGPGDGKAS